MPRARLYYIPRRGKIVTPFPAVAAPPVLIPRFAHTSVRAIFTARPRVFHPPFSSATTWTPTNVRVANRRIGLTVPRGRINNFIASTLPPPGPAPLVPTLSRAVVRSARGLLKPRRTSVWPPPVVLPPPPLPGAPQSSGGIVKDELHWWRDRD